MEHRRRMPGVARLVAVVVPVALIVAGVASPAAAFKPFTHSNTGFDARADVIDNGKVTIEGREYPVDPAVVAALRDWPSYYNAGVIGPDGFPDLTMGQSVIHPVDTGKWLKYVLSRAWAAQSDPSYSAAEKSQILAFSYGFLTHAAGDMWAHTLVNELSGEVFPAVSDVLTSPAAASIAIRHIIVEGYIGDATPGYDGNPDRNALGDGDVSDDSTRGIAFDSPNRFIYRTLVDPDAAGAPSGERGPLIGFFTDLRSSLADFVSSSPQPLQAALDKYSNTRDDLMNLGDACDFADVTDLIDCPLALLDLGFDVVVDSVEALHAFVTTTLEALAKVVLDAYVNAWIDDIDDGLADWGELGLASTRAFFDPQARRNTQNDECGPLGSETDQVRINCEDGIGMVDTLLHEADPFINDHLLSMLGAPDFVGGLREILAQVSDLIDDIVGPALNPVREVLADIKEAAAELVKDMIKDRFGLDIEQIQDFLDSPSSKMDLTSVDLGALGTVSLFAPDAHAKLDQYLGLPAGHHDGPGGGLGDDDQFVKTQFAAYQNAATTAKLLLLHGTQLDDVMSDLSGHSYHLYGPADGNLMTTVLPGAGTSTDQWLRLIDGDHAWRSTGLPVFDRKSAGEGNFPPWESCVLRDSGFRALYTDWENGAANFPNLGDTTSNDPNDPNPPVSSLTVGTPKFVSGGTTFVGAATPLTLVAHDDFWRDDEIQVDVRVRAGSATGGAFTAQANGSTVSLLGQPDGPVHLDLRAHDACRTEAVHTVDLVLDTTPPVVTYTEPALPQYATDELSSIAFTVDDGPQGSGVASSSVTFDGAPATNGQPLDMFFLDAGLHTVVVTATDNIGNTGTTPRTFRVRATAASLINNLDRAASLGLVRTNGPYNGLRATLEAAQRSHVAGRHPTEWNQLGAFVNQLQGQSGKGVDAATATRFIGYAQDLIASGG